MGEPNNSNKAKCKTKQNNNKKHPPTPHRKTKKTKTKKKTKKKKNGRVMIRRTFPHNPLPRGKSHDLEKATSSKTRDKGFLLH